MLITKKSARLYWLKSILFLSLSAAIIVTPVLHPCLAEAFSVGDEKKIGTELLSLVRKSFNLLEEPDIKQYINRIGKEILQVTGVQFFDYHFFVINDPEFNAFAAPSGLIFVHSGLIEAMENEGELISVLAHECGHVSSRHIADRMKKMSKTSIATAALIIAGIAVGGGAISEALITGSMAASSTMNLKFSRQDEEEADRLAYNWMMDMGLDPSPMASMLNKMHKISVYRMANIPPYLLTHPEPRRRLGYVQDLLLSDRKKGTVVAPRNNFSFLRIKQRVLSLTKKPAALTKLSSRTLSKSTSSELDTIMAHYGLYLAYLEEASFENARRELQIVINAHPSEPILLADLAMVDLKEGKYDKALGLLQEAHEKDSSDAFINFHLALTWQHVGEDEKALRLYSDLLVDNPEYTKLHYQIGQIKTKQGKNGEGHYYLGQYFWYEGDAKMAKFHIKQALADNTISTTIKAKAKTFMEMMNEVKE